MVLRRAFLALICMGCTAALPARALVEPGSGGRDGGAVSVLFLMGRGGEGALSVDATVAEHLRAKGYLLRSVYDREPLTADFLRRFNTVVVVGLEDYHGGSYYAPGGITLENTAQNVALLHDYVAEGGGLIVVPIMAGAGSQIAALHNDLLSPWNCRIGWETVRDEGRPVDVGLGPDDQIMYSWTRAVADHPAARGVQALAYPNGVMRWDDAYPSCAVLPGDAAWTALVKGEPGSRGMRVVDKRNWAPGEAGEAPCLAAARQAGKGRVAVIGLGGYYLITHAFAADEEGKGERAHIGENTTGPIDGIAFRKGDGATGSDWGLLLDNLLRWTAEASAAEGLGGVPPEWETQLGRRSYPSETIPDFAVVDWKTQELPRTWEFHSPTPTWWRGTAFYDEIPDPRVRGPQRMKKVLIGAHSAFSDGKGTVAEWAEAARAAGYAMLVFTERFEDCRADQWKAFVKECQAQSSPEFACLQGLDIADSYHNRFLLMGNVNFPTGGMLTPDGKRLEQTSRLSLGFSGHVVSVHRCGSTQLSPELYRHFQGVSVYTYADVGARNGKTQFMLADDGFAAYHWHLKNAGNPIPFAVHELYDPADVAEKGTVGFQVVVPAQDALDAKRYFRYGMDHFFENPQRYFITEGPIIDGWAIFNKDIGLPECNRDHWRALVGASSPDQTPIREAVLYERDRIARRWTPNAPSFSEIIDGEHGFQRHFMLVVTDAKGRRAISPHLRTVARGYYTRCGDRQNWFGAAGSYTGIWPSGSHGINYVMPILDAPGITERFRVPQPTHNLATKMILPFAGNAMTFTDYVINERYCTVISYGMDAWRIENTVPSRTYECWARVGKWHDIRTGLESNRGNLKTYTTVDAVLRSRMDVQPRSALFPVINSCGRDAAYRYGAGESLVEGQLDGRESTLIDLPAGAQLGEYLLLTPLTVNGKGQMGWRADTTRLVPKWTEWRAGYTYAPAEWRASLGVEGETPWRLELSRGKLESVLGMVNVAAEEYGVTGTLRAGGAMKVLPLRVQGLLARWPAALWTPDGVTYSMWSGLKKPEPLEGTTSGPPFLAHIGVFLDTGYAALPNEADTQFYVGNTLTSSNPDLHLAYAFWTSDAAAIEVHNPTGREITAELRSPDAIPGKFRVRVDVTVPAASSVRLELGG